MNWIHIVEALPVMVLVWYHGWKLGRGTRDERRQSAIESQRIVEAKYERLNSYVDTLFNETDMNRIGRAGYIAGRAEDDNWNAQKWIDETFTKPVAEVPEIKDDESIREWAAKYHADVRAGKKTY